MPNSPPLLGVTVPLVGAGSTIGDEVGAGSTTGEEERAGSTAGEEVGAGSAAGEVEQARSTIVEEVAGGSIVGEEEGPDPRPHARRRARRAALTAVVKPRRLGGSEREEGCRRGLREEGHRHGVGTRRSADVVGGRGRSGWCV